MGAELLWKLDLGAFVAVRASALRGGLGVLADSRGVAKHAGHSDRSTTFSFPKAAAQPLTHIFLAQMPMSFPALKGRTLSSLVL